jgi:hypothetical protein
MKLLTLLLVLLIVASCGVPGDFCTVYDPVYFDGDVAGQVAALDQDAARDMAANNLYYERECR